MLEPFAVLGAFVLAVVVAFAAGMVAGAVRKAPPTQCGFLLHRPGAAVSWCKRPVGHKGVCSSIAVTRHA